MVVRKSHSPVSVLQLAVLTGRERYVMVAVQHPPDVVWSRK